MKPGESMSQNKESVLFNRAIQWLKHENKTGEQPSFSELRTNGMLFNDNNATDEIEIVLTEAGEAAGYFVHPIDLINATLNAIKHIEQEASAAGQ